MNSWMLVLILKTLPKTDAKEFEETKIILKPRKEWKNDILRFSLLFVLSLLCFGLLSHIPYIAPFFFIGGFLGMIMSSMYFARAIFVWKNYDEIFSKDEIMKLDIKKF